MFRNGWFEDIDHRSPFIPVWVKESPLVKGFHSVARWYPASKLEPWMYVELRKVTRKHPVFTAERLTARIIQYYSNALPEENRDLHNIRQTSHYEVTFNKP